VAVCVAAPLAVGGKVSRLFEGHILKLVDVERFVLDGRSVSDRCRMTLLAGKSIRVNMLGMRIGCHWRTAVFSATMTPSTVFRQRTTPLWLLIQTRVITIAVAIEI
jgi:hypothetical protein